MSGSEQPSPLAGSSVVVPGIPDPIPGVQIQNVSILYTFGNYYFFIQILPPNLLDKVIKMNIPLPGMNKVANNNMNNANPMNVRILNLNKMSFCLNFRCQRSWPCQWHQQHPAARPVRDHSSDSIRALPNARNSPVQRDFPVFSLKWFVIVAFSQVKFKLYMKTQRGKSIYCDERCMFHIFSQAS